MNRAEALAALIERVEAGERPNGQWDEVPRAFPNIHDRFALDDAYRFDRRDAVATLEAPLRARGWFSSVEGNGGGQFYAELSLSGRTVFGRAGSEARARLLAVLRALLLEERA